MIPIQFQQANCNFHHPDDMSEQQVATVPAYRGTQRGGSCDGAELVVVAWKPSSEEIDKLRAGANLYLTVLGGLPPHALTTSFEEATNLA